MPDTSPSISRKVLATYLLILMIVAVMFGYLAWNEYQREKVTANELVSSRAQLVASHAEWLVSAGVQTLDAADRLAGSTINDVPARTAADIAAIVNALPEGTSLSFLDLNGKTTFATNPAVAANTPVDWQDALNHPPNGRPYVSAMTTRDDANGQYFMISRPIIRLGKSVGVATLFIPADVMLSLWSTVDLGWQSTIGLVRDDGWLVARYPAPKEPVNLADYILFTEYLKKADHGTYEAQSPVDGQNRVVGYRRVKNAPLVALASADQQVVMRPFWTYFTGVATLLVGLLAICAVAVLWSWRLLAEDDVRKLQLAESAEHRAWLLREIHHRVKNNLQTVASLVRLQPMDPDAKRDLTARISAMSAVHEQSYRLDQFDELDLDDYLRTLMENARQSYGTGIVMEAELRPMTISRDVALPLGLIVNEVISNAAKHAFKEQTEPRILVKLAWADANRAVLTVHDNGTGYSPDDNDSGMGLRLISAFAQQLGGEFAYEDSNGTQFKVAFGAKAPDGSVLGEKDFEVEPS